MCVPPSCRSVGCEGVSCVLCQVCSSFVRFCRLIFKQQLTSSAAAVKRTACFHNWFRSCGGRFQKRAHYKLQLEFWDDKSERAFHNERSLRILLVTTCKILGVQDCCWRTILFEDVQDSSTGFFGNLWEWCKVGAQGTQRRSGPSRHLRRHLRTSSKTSVRGSAGFVP